MYWLRQTFFCSANCKKITENVGGDGFTLPVFLSATAQLRKATVSFVIFFRPFFRPSAQNSSALAERIFMKFDVWGFCENLSKKFKFY
jgi:hypothetical protein